MYGLGIRHFTQCVHVSSASGKFLEDDSAARGCDAMEDAMNGLDRGPEILCFGNSFKTMA